MWTRSDATTFEQSHVAQDHSILLPIYAQMTEEDQVRVADAVKEGLQ